MKVVWTRKASRHLRASYDYWAGETSAEAAETMLDRIFSAVELLEKFPEAGRQGRIPKTRELIMLPLPFVIAYRVKPNKIEIIALFPGARKWPGKF